MPVVPRRDAATVPTAPLPGVRVPTDVPSGAFQPAAPVDISAFSSQVAQIVQRETAKADQLAALKADNALAKLQTDLHTKASQRRGRDGLEATGDVTDSWRTGVGEIEKTLTNDRQRAAFAARASLRWESLYGAVERHAADEYQKADALESETAIANRVNDALTNYQDPQAVAKAAVELRAIVRDHGRRQGWAPEVVAAKAGEHMSRLHAGVIGRFLAVGDDRAAQAYYDKAKSQILGDHADTIDRALDVASTEGTAMRVANTVWRSLGPKTLYDPAKIATMEQSVRDTQGANAKVVKATIQELRSRVQAHNAEQQEVTASRKANLLGAFNKGASVARLVRTSDYLQLPGDEQERLKKYMLDGAPGNSFAAYWDYSEPAKLAEMSEKQILALEPELGRSLTGQLMTHKRSLSTAGLRTATIDDDQFRSLAHGAGFNVYATGQSVADKETLGQLKNAVEAEIATRQSGGKLLTREDKAKVMQGIIDTKVMQSVFGKDRQVTAATVRPEDRSKVYTPIADVPLEYSGGAINWMRSIGLVGVRESDYAVRTRFKSRIERAYAAQLAGASPDDVFGILRGTAGKPAP